MHLGFLFFFFRANQMKQTLNAIFFCSVSSACGSSSTLVEPDTNDWSNAPNYSIRWFSWMNAFAVNEFEWEMNFKWFLTPQWYWVRFFRFTLHYFRPALMWKQLKATRQKKNVPFRLWNKNQIGQNIAAEMHMIDNVSGFYFEWKKNSRQMYWR